MSTKFADNPRLKHGTLATVITVGFIVIMILINVILTILFERNPLTIDLTTDGRFEITQSTVDFINTITSDVTITVCATESDLANSDYETYKQAYEIIMGYPKISDKIKVKFVDLVKDPSFAKQYPDEEFYTNDIFIESNGRTRKIQMAYMFQSTSDPQTGELFYRSLAEQNMTSAIDYVVDENPVTVSVLTGINSVDISAYLYLLESNNYNIIEQNFLLDDIDQDATIIILPQPATDLTVEQADQIDKFLDNGGYYGKSMIFVPSLQREVEPVLAALLADWGIEVLDSTLVETDSSNYFQDVPTMLVTEFASNEFSQIANTTQPVIIANGREINTVFDERDNRTTTVLMRTASSTISIPFDQYELPFESFTQGRYNTVVLGQRTVEINGVDTHSNMICISSEATLGDWFLSYAGFGNASTYLSLANYVANKQDSVEVIPIVFDNQTMVISSQAVQTYSIFFGIVLPLILLGFGLYVWLRRRHL